MKWLLVLVMVGCVVVSGELGDKEVSHVDERELELMMNWEGLMVCLNCIKPIAMDVKELYMFVVNKDYANAVVKVVEIVQKGGEAAKVCYNAYKDMGII